MLCALLPVSLAVCLPNWENAVKSGLSSVPQILCEVYLACRTKNYLWMQFFGLNSVQRLVLLRDLLRTAD